MYTQGKPSATLYQTRFPADDIDALLFIGLTDSHVQTPSIENKSRTTVVFLQNTYKNEQYAINLKMPPIQPPHVVQRKTDSFCLLQKLPCERERSSDWNRTG